MVGRSATQRLRSMKAAYVFGCSWLWIYRGSRLWIYSRLRPFSLLEVRGLWRGSEVCGDLLLSARPSADGEVLCHQRGCSLRDCLWKRFNHASHFLSVLFLSSSSSSLILSFLPFLLVLLSSSCSFLLFFIYFSHLPTPLIFLLLIYSFSIFLSHLALIHLEQRHIVR